MGILGEMRAVPRTWYEELLGLLARPMEAAGQWGEANQQEVGGWDAPFDVIADAAPFAARAIGDWGGQLREASEGMPLTSDAGYFPPDSPLSFLNQRVNERGAAVLDATTGILAPAATRVGKAAAQTAKAIPDIAMDAYGPQRSASWMFLTKDAQKADMDKLARAFELEQNGADPKDIWAQTGWFRAPWDQQWRFEIDDSKARQSMARYPRGTTLGKYWKHPELYENHPELANVRVWPGTAEQGTGAYTADDLFGIDRIQTPRPADPSITAHEVQHGVQRQSGTAFGGGQSTAWSDPQLRPAAEAEVKRLWEVSVQKLADAGRLDVLDNLSDDQLRMIHDEMRRMAGQRIYPRLAGEAEARLTQARLGMNAEQRAQSFPLDHMREMLAAEQGGGPGSLYGIEDLIPRYVSRPGDLRMQMPPLGASAETRGLIDTAESIGDGILRKHVTLTEQDGGILGKTTVETPQTYPAKMGKWPLRSDQGDLNVPTSYRPDKFTGLSAEAQSFIKQFKTDDFRNKTAVHYNEKTGLSLDFSTSCTKRSGGGCNAGACAYCYVEHDRSAKKAGMGTPTSPKKLVENDYEDEILRMPADLVTNLNRDGGLRMFSFGDFRPGVDDDNVARALADAQKRGLYIKAITKEPALIERFGDHPNFRANLSIDYLPREASNSFTIDDALALKAGRENIKLRGVALNMEEAERMAADPRIDVITLYHGPTGDRLYKIVAEQNPKLVEKFGGEAALRAELDRWQNMSPRNGAVKEFMERNAGRVCCQGGKCSTDPHTKCGFASKAVGALLPGVAVPAWFDEEGTPEYF